MSDLKEQVTQLLCCLFEKMIGKLQEQLGGMLTKGLGLDGSGGGGLGDFLEKLDTVTPKMSPSSSYLLC